MLKRVFYFFVAMLLILGLQFAVLSVSQQQHMAQQLIRLHVLANSDNSADQSVKYKVRDAVVKQLQPELAQCQSKQEAEAYLAAHLDDVEETAARVLQEEGFAPNVTAALKLVDFPTREYDTFTLPAGTYRSLQIIIGSGQGHNWWCVVFPSLCAGATAQTVTAEAACAGFTQEETNWITGDSNYYTIKFKTVELVAQLLQWIKP